MKLALLGADEDSLDLVRWALGQNRAGQGGYDLVAAYDSDPFGKQLQALAPQIRLNQSWEELAVASAADAVIIGRGGKYLTDETGIDHAERRADQLRKLVQAAVPMIVVCPACEAIVGFEIEMIRRDTKAVIIPYIPAAAHPAVTMLAELISLSNNSPLGQIEQISLDREQTDRSRDTVLLRLSRDATLLRQLIGSIQSVSATGPAAPIGRDPLGPKPKELPSLANLSVHFGGDDGLTARWSISPAIATDKARLTILGNRGKSVLSMPSSGNWQLQIAGDASATESFDSSTSTSAQQAFRQLSVAISSDEQSDDSTWLAACRDQEAAEAVDRSLARGRTIELFNEQHTEEESFKGIMAMGGCFLLVMSVAFVLLAAIIEGLQLPMREWRIWQPWPFYLLIPLGAFLLLQFLQLAIKRDAPAAP